MQGSTREHQSEAMRVMKWVLGTPNIALKLKPTPVNKDGKQKFVLKGICDALFAPENKTCKSVTGYIVYLNDAPVDWKSRAQKHVTLSSTESEYVAVSEVVRVLLEAEQIIE